VRLPAAEARSPVPSPQARTSSGLVSELRIFSVECGIRNLTIVQVETDEGITGLGEATLEWHDEPVAASIKALSDVIAGRDAGRIEYLWQLMLRSGFWRGGPTHLTALSAIDQALWDIKGKASGLPVYDLLGGRCRDVVPLYANGPRGSTPEEYAASAVDLVELGYRAMKVCPVEPTADLDGNEALEHVVQAVRSIRRAIGPQVKLAIDFHGRLSPAMAIRCSALIEPFDIWFIEEPALPDNVDALTAISRAATVPLASGERWLTRSGFRRALELRALAAVQPDVAHCGGVSEQRRIAAMAEVDQVSFAPHNPLGPVGTMATAHVAMATPNFLTLERAEGDISPWRDAIITTAATIGDGILTLTDAPGFGMELNADICLAHPGRAVPRPALCLPDGSFSEW
jgi:galactonate dehydratase